MAFNERFSTWARNATLATLNEARGVPTSAPTPPAVSRGSVAGCGCAPRTLAPTATCGCGSGASTPEPGLVGGLGAVSTPVHVRGLETPTVGAPAYDLAALVRPDASARSWALKSTPGDLTQPQLAQAERPYRRPDEVSRSRPVPTGASRLGRVVPTAHVNVPPRTQQLFAGPVELSAADKAPWVPGAFPQGLPGAQPMALARPRPPGLAHTPHVLEPPPGLRVLSTRRLQKITNTPDANRLGIEGTDLGVPVEHNGHLYLFFGDAELGGEGTRLWIRPMATAADVLDGGEIQFLRNDLRPVPFAASFDVTDVDNRGASPPARLPGLPSVPLLASTQVTLTGWDTATQSLDLHFLGSFLTPHDGEAKVDRNGEVYLYQTKLRLGRPVLGTIPSGVLPPRRRR